MTNRLEILIDELVLQSEGPFDAAAFERDLARALSERLGNRPAASVGAASATSREVADQVAAAVPPRALRTDVQ
jgi:hypothetical protein